MTHGHHSEGYRNIGQRAQGIQYKCKYTKDFMQMDIRIIGYMDVGKRARDHECRLNKYCTWA
jgi:hypothetical protein